MADSETPGSRQTAFVSSNVAHGTFAGQGTDESGNGASFTFSGSLNGSGSGSASYSAPPGSGTSDTYTVTVSIDEGGSTVATCSASFSETS